MASFSPKGHFVAYTSSESGQQEVYVQPFPPNGSRWTVSSGGGEEPIWSPNGDKLIYRNGNNWMEVPTTMEPTFSTLTPTLLFSGSYVNVPGYSYDISPDGQRFLLFKPVSNARTATRLKVVKNWFEEVNRLAPRE
jgi:serine/threonine-protein kinase